MTIDRTALMLILFVAMTLAFLYARPVEPTSGIGVDEYIYLKVYAKHKYEAVFAGDSTVESSVSCDDFISVSKHSSAFNLGFGGIGFYKKYLDAVEAKLDKNSENPTIFLGITPRSLVEYAVNNNNFNKWSREYSADSFNYLIPPTWKYAFRPIIALDVHEALKGKSSGYCWVMHPDGWVATSKIPETKTVEHEDAFDRLGNYEVSDRLLTLLALACKQWNEKGIAVYAYLSPMAGGSQTVNMKRAGLDPARLRRLLENAGATWLKMPDVKYHYCDGLHMHYDDAPRFSRDLAKAYLKVQARKDRHPD